MMFSFVLQDCAVTPFGGQAVTLSGRVQSDHKFIATLQGATGSGKTTLLAVIAHFFRCPAFRGISKLQRSQVSCSTPIGRDHVGVVRQNPAENFMGNCVAEEIELMLGVSRLSHDEFKKKLEELWIRHFGEDLSALSRHANQLSSGQQQILSILLQVLRIPDLLLADEPLARLSDGNARLVVRLLSELSEKAYVIISSHKDALVSDSRKSPFGPNHIVELEETSMCVTDGGAAPASEFADLTATEAAGMFLDWTSYNQERDDTGFFARLPEKTVRVVAGSGPKLMDKSIDMDVFIDSAKTPTVVARGLDLRRGINILYGDNGSGKTLVGRALGGDLRLNPIRWPFHIAHARGGLGAISPTAAGDGTPGGATLNWLQKNHRCYFLSSDPKEVLAENGTIEGELRSVYGSDEDVQARLSLIKQFGLAPERQVEALSFGEKKLVSICMLRDCYSVLVLDEVFANLSQAVRLSVGQLILHKCKSGAWSVVIMTSNRPCNTFNVLRECLVAETSCETASNG